LVTAEVIIGNLVNLVLDIILVFGIEGWIPSMGATGAGIATAIGEFIQVIIIFIIFLAPKYKNKFGTWDYKFEKRIFKDCLRIGAPNSISHTIELAAWYIVFVFMGWMNKDYVTVLQIGQTIFIFLAFMSDGLQRGVMALCSNAIGEKKYIKIGKVFKSAFQFHLIVIGIFAIFLLYMPNLVVRGFLSEDVFGITSDVTFKETEMALRWVWAYLALDGLMWVIAGILTAAGDTKFVMMVSAAGAWLFVVLPVYVFIILFKGEAHVVWQLTAFYGFMNLIFFYFRYRSGKWKSIKIRSEIG
jgi:MATE family multidrug resistance protein